jgi:hypothetical protein
MMSPAGGLRELLRPPPHRGPLIAAGAVALTVGVAITEFRLRDELPLGVHAPILLALGALVFWLGAQAPNEEGQPPAYQSVLLATGLPVLYAGTIVLAIALGAHFDPLSAGALLWTSGVVGIVALWPALERNSAICVFFAALLGAVVLLCAWAWMLGWSTAAARWLLAVYAGALVVFSLALREPARRHAEMLINAAALAIAFIGLGPQTHPLRSDLLHLPWFWQLVLLGAGFGLTAFGALDRSPGPAYLGVINLILFILSASDSKHTLIGWPLFLLAGGIVMLAAGLRPRRPLPPEPDPYRAGEAPLAARAEGDDIFVRVRDE